MMRNVLAIAALLACTAASQPSTAELSKGLPSAAELSEGNWPDISELQPPPVVGETVCRDRIHMVREELGLPALERETAELDEGYLIAAVDKRIDGCSVMVMLHDTSDIRPLPKVDPHPKLRPAQ